MKSLLTTREKEKLIEEFEISRKSYVIFSKEKRINPRTFTTWVYKWRKAKEEKIEVNFVKINGTFLKKEAKIKIKKSRHRNWSSYRYWRKTTKKHNNSIGGRMKIDYEATKIFVRPGSTDLRKGGMSRTNRIF